MLTSSCTIYINFWVTFIFSVGLIPSSNNVLGFGIKKSNLCIHHHSVGSQAESWLSRTSDDSLQNILVRKDYDKCVTSLGRLGHHFMGKKSTEHLLNKPWLPSINVSEDDNIFAVDEKRESLEKKSIQHLVNLIKAKLNYQNDSLDEEESNEIDNASESNYSVAKDIVKGCFRDLACTIEGEIVLEKMFYEHSEPALNEQNSDTIRGSIVALKSLLIMGMQVGVKGTPEQQQKLTAHLYSRTDEATVVVNDMEEYLQSLSSRKLKRNIDLTAATQLLAELKRKRSNQSAFDLLVQLGAWRKHEDIALLRSGFPMRFTEEEEKAAAEAELNPRDPDELLGLRKDLRDMKVYTIDSEHTSDIDDGLSIEVVTKPDGTKRHRIWIHIADADKWAPRDSEIFKAAGRRTTSVYTPTGSVPMFPSNLSAGVMSLRANHDSYALSLSVELDDDGMIDDSTIQVMPSLISVNYRLAYDEVDEMLEMGIGYFEEWELGALLSEASKRRKFRIAMGSTEGFVTRPIPQVDIRVLNNDTSQDGIDIVVKVEGSHNAGFNQSSYVLDMNGVDDYAPAVSSSFLLVTEMMIMAGEAMGKFKMIAESRQADIDTNVLQLENKLDLPYRTQPRPDLSARYQELNTLNSLKERGYCHAWYARRFFEAVRVLDEPLPHYGLGLDCYVQWSSPIRRFGDLQVHAAVKRFLRKERINIMMQNGDRIPDELRDSDLGCPVPNCIESPNKTLKINYKKGLGFIKAARTVQKKSNEYWLFEYIRRRIENSETEVEFAATVLGCVDPNRYQYAIYVHELGLEHKYLSERGYIQTGDVIWLKVDSVSPRYGLLTFILSSKSSGRSRKSALAA